AGIARLEFIKDRVNGVGLCQLGNGRRGASLFPLGYRVSRCSNLAGSLLGLNAGLVRRDVAVKAQADPALLAGRLVAVPKPVARRAAVQAPRDKPLNLSVG